MDSLDNLKATELTLRLPGADHIPAAKGSKRVLSEVNEECHPKKTADSDSERDTAGTVPAAKAQVVGWPPVRSYRVNSIRAKKAEAEDGAGIYVKVGMDGAPYLRKVDLKVCKGYKDLRVSLENMFKCFSLGEGEGYDGSEYAITYEDKDGDWMLVGDVPWEMFISSCKRMRIMKGSEAKGLSLSH